MAKISKILARPILDSRSNWTVEASVKSSSGRSASASVPSGISRGSFEAKGVPPKRAVKNIDTVLARALNGTNLLDQKKIDQVMIDLDGTPDKSRLGANAILAVSLAVARLAAIEEGNYLWKYLRDIYAFKANRKPRLFMNMIEGGLHADSPDIFQEYLVIPRAESYSRAVEVGLNIFEELRKFLQKKTGTKRLLEGDEAGFSAKFKDLAEPLRILFKITRESRLIKQVDFGIDAAASNMAFLPSKLTHIYLNLKNNFGVTYIEDPFGEKNAEFFSALLSKLGSGVLIAGDDLTVTNKERMAEAHNQSAINAVVIKPNQIGTLTETLEAVRLARKWNWHVLCSHRGGETNDSFIADLAYAVGADGLKLGAPARGERVAKYNRLLEIERSED